MKSISTARVNHILFLLDSGKDGYAAARSAGVSPSTVSRIYKKHHSSLQKSLGVHPVKLSPANIYHAQHLIYSGKAKNASQLTNPLANIINQPLSTQTVHCTLKKAGMVAEKGLFSVKGIGGRDWIGLWHINTGLWIGFVTSMGKPMGSESQCL